MLNDFRYAFRRLIVHRGTTLIAICTLALGIGANTTVLSAVNALLFKPVDAASPRELVWVSTRSVVSGRYQNWSYPDYTDFAKGAQSFAGVVAFGTVDISIGGESPERIRGLAVSGNYFSVLGVPMETGRGFAQDEDRVAGDRAAVVLSHGFWNRRFGARADIAGSVVTLNGHAYTVIGVARKGFHGVGLGQQQDAWITMAQMPLIETQFGRMGRGSHWLDVMARLKPDVSIERATSDAVGAFRRIAADTITSGDVRTVQLARANGSLDPSNRSQTVPILALVMVVPILVLLVACANLANLLIARAVSRRRELAVRTALGASRSDLVRLMLAECILLAVGAAIVGTIGSSWLTLAIAYFGNLPAHIRPALAPDAPVFVATALLALVTGVLFGLVPSLAATRDALTPALKNESVTLRVGRERHRLRNVFVVAQVAVSLTLLITAGLFVGSLTKALRVDPGFNPHNAFAVSYDLSAQGYTVAQRDVFNKRLLDVLASTQGIQSAAIANVIPLSNRSFNTAIAREGATERDERFNAATSTGSPAFFATLEIPLVRGRTFTDADNAGNAKVAVVNETLAAELWPGVDPLGRRFQFRGELREVVGVARNGRYRSLAESRPVSAFYLPSAQDDIGVDVTLIVRSPLPMAAAIEAMRAVFKSLDPNLPLYRITSLDQNVASTADDQRGGAALLGVFGVLGLVLAGLGIYGVISQGVASRTREIGIRMSLGARAIDVVRSFMREGVVLTAVGATIGILLSLTISRLLTTLLFGLAPTDIVTFAAASAVLVIVALVASLVPARRAARVDPLVALRAE